MTLSDELSSALVAVYGKVPSLPIPRADVKKVRRAVAGVVFGRRFEDEDALDEFLGDQENYAKSNQINRRLIEATGIGPDLFTVTSLSHPDIETDSMTTLLAFDQAHFSEVEETIAASSGKKLRQYRESLYFLWTRSLVDGELVYGFLSAAGPYLWQVLEDVLSGWMDENFPVRPLVARTQEEVAAEIDRQITNSEPEETTRFETYAAGSRLINTMLEDEGHGRMFDGDAPWVHRNVTRDGHEIREDIVCSNAAAMERVRFGSFHADVASLPDGSAEFEARVAVLVEKFRHRLSELVIIPKTDADG